MRSKLLLFLSCLFAAPAAFSDSAHCGDEGIWIKILGAGSGELSDGQGPPSFLIWQDNVARLLIDTGSGSSVDLIAPALTLTISRSSPSPNSMQIICRSYAPILLVH